MTDGALGLTIIENGDIVENSFKYKKNITNEDIIFGENEYIINEGKIKTLICKD